MFWYLKDVSNIIFKNFFAKDFSLISAFVAAISMIHDRLLKLKFGEVNDSTETT